MMVGTKWRGTSAAGRGRLSSAALVALVGLAMPSGVRAQDAGAILQAAADAYGRIHTLCADFTQELSVPLLGEERTGLGRMCQSQPDRFAMRFTQPAGDLIVADGTWVWVYYPSLDDKQVIKFPLAQGARSFDFHREFLDDPASKYDATYQGRATVGEHAVHRIRLVPRANASYEAAVISIDVAEPVLRQVRVEEENGSVRTVTLEAIDTQPELGSDWFTFTPPPGAVVITR